MINVKMLVPVIANIYLLSSNCLIQTDDFKRAFNQYQSHFLA